MSLSCRSSRYPSRLLRLRAESPSDGLKKPGNAANEVALAKAVSAKAVSCRHATYIYCYIYCQSANIRFGQTAGGDDYLIGLTAERSLQDREEASLEF